ncbi:MAG: Uma2 family endonuclease [Thermoflexales bacterium]|nr:Uma2 family endonuclease [Thermoflexales bacterium]MCS7325585.1 Uma2 family endonuclease [Thermoflexales bacterium]MDW8053146.1 Uma2 family endonuclease [Anaerolineae bacterium]MDW8291798.1 Uma2 family endonuclease [Anaerolineae bacterium]
MTPNPFAVLRAKQRAWLITLLSTVVDAYELGAVLGPGAVIRSNGETLTPDVVYLSNAERAITKANAVHGAVPLAIDVLHSGVDETTRAALRARYATARVLEYWQVDADRGRATFYQADAHWRYDPIPPDAKGVYYSAAIVQLMLPVVWLRHQPNLLTMLEWWGLLEPK